MGRSAVSVPTQVPAPEAPSDEVPGPFERWRLAVLGGLALVAVVCVVLLFVGVDSTRLRVVVLVGANGVIAAKRL
jgi:hypothetical protein